MVMAVATSGMSGAGLTRTQAEVQMADIITQNTNALASGTKINSARSSASVAGATQALANQTGGNILGFTYE